MAFEQISISFSNIPHPYYQYSEREFVQISGAGVQEGEETGSFVHFGYVNINGQKGEREVRIHRRDTGELLKTATSDRTTGYYEVSVNYDGLCYAIILEDVSTQLHNAAAIDFITPVAV